ncbi:cupin domain-containing protein [Sphingomonas corticis]|uniref:Cupin domain-containing protein n=1 Tax=Sphingomonas corticis TaxID=2722791 RepID=A0ABX1CQP9_9SPHN|nr:cupin domain-containing protein [Sphingomonas corticis]NJR80280.1 cupin domain-containing protein [Sphingomonas corticis]
MHDTEPPTPVALVAQQAPGRGSTNYPPEFAAKVRGRFKRPLGDAFGLNGFGVNLTTLEPGSQSSVMHRHTVQDEFVFVVSGELVLRHEGGEATLSAGTCAGFPAGGRAHCLVNRSDAPATYLEIGDRRPGDTADYPEDDLVAVNVDGRWTYTRKDGSPY